MVVPLVTGGTGPSSSRWDRRGQTAGNHMDFGSFSRLAPSQLARPPFGPKETPCPHRYPPEELVLFAYLTPGAGA